MVNSIITYTLSIHNHPPKSLTPLAPLVRGETLSGGLHEASIGGTIGERLHIYGEL